MRRVPCPCQSGLLKGAAQLNRRHRQRKRLTHPSHAYGKGTRTGGKLVTLFAWQGRLHRCVSDVALTITNGSCVPFRLLGIAPDAAFDEAVEARRFLMEVRAVSMLCVHASMHACMPRCMKLRCSDPKHALCPCNIHTQKSMLQRCVHLFLHGTHTHTLSET